MQRYCHAYDALAFDLEEYVPRDVDAPIITVIERRSTPGSKNMDLAPETVTAMLERYGLDPTRPIVCQISPFDRWHDPWASSKPMRGGEAGARLAAALWPPTWRGPGDARYYEQVARGAEPPDIFVLSSHSSSGAWQR